MLGALKPDQQLKKLVEITNDVCKADIGKLIEEGPEVKRPGIFHNFHTI